MWVNWGVTFDMGCLYQTIVIDDVVVARHDVNLNSFRRGFVVLVVEALLACGVGPPNIYKYLNWEKCMVRCVYPRKS